MLQSSAEWRPSTARRALNSAEKFARELRKIWPEVVLIEVRNEWEYDSDYPRLAPNYSIAELDAWEANRPRTYAGPQIGTVFDAETSIYESPSELRSAQQLLEEYANDIGLTSIDTDEVAIYWSLETRSFVNTPYGQHLIGFEHPAVIDDGLPRLSSEVEILAEFKPADFTTTQS